MGQYALIRIDEYAQYAALYYGGEYQIVYAVHEDSRHLHVHFVLNTLNYRTGKKYPGDKEDYYNFQRYLKDHLYYSMYGMKLIAVSDTGDDGEEEYE